MKQMKTKARLFALCLGLLMLVVFAGSVLVVFADADVKAFGDGGHEAQSVPEGKGVVGMHIGVNGEFSAFSFVMPTWTVSGKYSAYLSVYRWDTDYKTTVSAEPLATKEFTGLNDCAENRFVLPSPLPAGEYFFAIEKTVGNVGCWLVPGTAVSKGYTFIDGIESEQEMELRIRFKGTQPAEPFVKVESHAVSYGDAPTYERVTDIGTDLSGYGLPADSLYLRNGVMPDTWVFTDGLGRRALTNQDVGDPRADRTLMIFYSSWHASMSNSKAFNIQQFLDAEVAKGTKLEDILYDYDYAGWPKSGYQHFWNEPVFGYYRTDDPWVLRRQGEMLANALVDAISTDNTNGTMTWKDSYTAIYETWLQAQKDGVNTPKVSYMLPFAPGANTNTQLESLYLDIYRDGKYQSLWFWWDEKPMMLAHGYGLDTTKGLHKEISKFFSFRTNYPGYLNESPQLKNWGWLAVYPQPAYYASNADRRKKVIEEMTVGIAQNHDWKLHLISAMNGPNNTGRTYTSKGYDTRENAKLYGANFAEQFEYALKADPKLIYLTGWNEWIAGRYQSWPDIPESAVKNAFPDQFNDENSRDAEPSRGDLKDHYYYQMVNFIRQYKGVRAIPVASVNKTIDIAKGTEQWKDVTPYYAAYIGNTGNRDFKGYTDYYYTDFSGRNDIIGTQMTRDADNIYLLIECASDITPYTDPLWMHVYLDTDAGQTGWESFDYVINKTSPKNESVAYLEKFTGNGYESKVVAEVSYHAEGRYLQIAIKKADIGISGDDFTVNYSVTDNIHDRDDAGQKQENGSYVYTVFSGDILDFYTSGDVAPSGRFQYSFISTKENAIGKTEDTSAGETSGDETSVSDTGESTTGADTEKAEDSTDVEKQNGCGSVALLSVSAVLAVAGAVILRKKKD